MHCIAPLPCLEPPSDLESSLQCLRTVHNGWRDTMRRTRPLRTSSCVPPRHSILFLLGITRHCLCPPPSLSTRRYPISRLDIHTLLHTRVPVMVPLSPWTHYTLPFNEDTTCRTRRTPLVGRDSLRPLARRPPGTPVRAADNSPNRPTAARPHTLCSLVSLAAD